MEHLSNNHKDRPNQQTSHKLYDETEHPDLSLTESQWKLRHHDENFPMEGKLL